MPDLITLVITAFLFLLFAEALAGAIMRRDIYELKDAAASITIDLGNVFIDLSAKALWKSRLAS